MSETERKDAEDNGVAGRSGRLAVLLPRGASAGVVYLTAGALAAASLAVEGVDVRGLVGVVLGPVLALLTAIDLRHRVLPNLIVLPATGVFAVIVAVGEPTRLPAHVAAGVVFAGVLLGAALLSRGGIGMGDVKLALLIGVALGGATAAALVLTSLASLIVGLGVLLFEGRSGLKRTMAFGPLLALGAVVAFFAT